MKIISYNVNGIRAAMNKGLLDWIIAAKPDVFCIQETKATKDQVDIISIESLGYHHYWFSAQKKGYSGVSIWSKEQPNHIEYGCGIEKYDNEGRVIRADFADASIISVYMPSGSSGDHRQDFKMKWLSDFKDYIDKLKTDIPNLIISGDYNICHQAIDIHDPVRNAAVSGFLPEEREWMTEFIESGFIDTFRYFNQNPHNYSWWSYRANARNNNKGWRIDYNMASKNLEGRLKFATILPEARHSDHCPVVLELK